MHLPYANIHLTEEDKLEAIRHLDSCGKWESLDALRFCSVCKKLINGREIEVMGGTRGLGPLRLHCPTAECYAGPADWESADRYRGRVTWRVIAGGANGRAHSHDARVDHAA